MTDDIELPWIEESVELPEAVELVAHAGYHDEAMVEELRERVDRLENWVTVLTDASGVDCPTCEQTDEVYKAGVGAAKLANDGNLTAENANALNVESHVCLRCQESFTPDAE